MSKITNAVAAKLNRQCAPPTVLASIDYESNFTPDLFALHGDFTLSVTIGARAKYPMAGSGEAVQHAVNQCKRIIAEEVFGEFRPMRYKIKQALMLYDLEKVDEAVDDIFKQMFEVKP